MAAPLPITTAAAWRAHERTLFWFAHATAATACPVGGPHTHLATAWRSVTQVAVVQRTLLPN